VTVGRLELPSEQTFGRGARLALGTALKAADT
jgi:hypothetical protein